MAVAIVPGLLVAVLAARRDQMIEQLWQIALQSWFKLDGPNGACAADIEYVGRADLNTAFGHNQGDAVGDILHVPMAYRFDIKLLLSDHEVITRWVAVLAANW